MIVRYLDPLGYFGLLHGWRVLEITPASSGPLLVRFVMIEMSPRRGSNNILVKLPMPNRLYKRP